jgi:hypothetical protein
MVPCFDKVPGKCGQFSRFRDLSPVSSIETVEHHADVVAEVLSPD